MNQQEYNEWIESWREFKPEMLDMKKAIHELTISRPVTILIPLEKMPEKLDIQSERTIDKNIIME